MSALAAATSARRLPGLRGEAPLGSTIRITSHICSSTVATENSTSSLISWLWVCGGDCTGQVFVLAAATAQIVAEAPRLHKNLSFCVPPFCHAVYVQDTHAGKRA